MGFFVIYNIPQNLDSQIQSQSCFGGNKRKTNIKSNTQKDIQTLELAWMAGADVLTMEHTLKAHAVLMNDQELSARRIANLLLRDYKTVKTWLALFKRRRISSLFTKHQNNTNASKLTRGQKR